MSKENQNSAFEIEARKQQAFDDTTREKVKNHQALNDEEIMLTTSVIIILREVLEISLMISVMLVISHKREMNLRWFMFSSLGGGIGALAYASSIRIISNSLIPASHCSCAIKDLAKFFRILARGNESGDTPMRSRISNPSISI